MINKFEINKNMKNAEEENNKLKLANEFCEAADDGNVTELERLLRLGDGACINYQNKRGDTALILACRSLYHKESDKILRLLIESKANLNLQNPVRDAAVLYAASWRHYNSLRLAIPLSLPVVQDFQVLMKELNV